MTKAVAIPQNATDPLPPGRIAIWLFLASDLMFFVGLVGAFIVLRAGNQNLFADHARGLSKPLGAAGVVALGFSSVSMFAAVRATRTQSRKACGIALVMAMLCAAAFIGLRAMEYTDALNHHTIIVRQEPGGPLVLYDGRIDWWNGGGATGPRILDGYASPIPRDFDPHVVSQDDVAAMAPQGNGNPKEFTLTSELFQDVRYGPGKNIFYAIWYTLTGAHLLHLLAGMTAIAMLLIQYLRRRLIRIHVECAGIFWHFMVMVGIVLFSMLYLG